MGEEESGGIGCERYVMLSDSRLREPILTSMWCAGNIRSMQKKLMEREARRLELREGSESSSGMSV